jgi:O-antigen ligase
MLIGSIGFMIYYILVYFIPIFTFDLSTRLGFYFDDPNYLGRYFLFIIVFLLYFVLIEKKHIFIPLLIFTFYLMVTTGSISNLLCSFIVLFLFAWYTIPKGKKYYLSASLFALIIVGIFVLQLDALSYFRIRIYGIINSFFGNASLNGDASTEYRYLLATEAFYMFLKKPFFGYGFYSVASYSLTQQFSHNNFTDLLANHGIFATIIFEYLLVMPLAKISRLKAKEKILYLALMIYMFIFQVFLVTYYHKFEYFVFALVYAFIYDPNAEHFSLGLKLNVKVAIENSIKKREDHIHA